MGLALLVLIPALLSALSGWRNALDIGAFKAALPVPALLFSLSAVLGLYLVVMDDWTDMRHAIGALLTLFGFVLAGACLLVGWGAGRIRLRQDGRL